MDGGSHMAQTFDVQREETQSLRRHISVLRRRLRLVKASRARHRQRLILSIHDDHLLSHPNYQGGKDCVLNFLAGTDTLQLTPEGRRFSNIRECHGSTETGVAASPACGRRQARAGGSISTTRPARQSRITIVSLTRKNGETWHRLLGCRGARGNPSS
jgi:hypothetical protein